MLRFIVRRTLQMIPTLLAIVIVIFVIFSVVPGSFITSLMAEGRTVMNADVLAHLNEQFGLDKPLPVRLWDYLWGLAHFDLGISYRTRSPVWDVIEPRLWPSIKLALTAMALAAAVGIPLGFLSAYSPNGLVDHLSRVLTIAGMSMPVFWLGVLFQIVFFKWLGVLPSGGRLGIIESAPPHLTGLYTVDALAARSAAARSPAKEHLTDEDAGLTRSLGRQMFSRRAGAAACGERGASRRLSEYN